jgi:hypothetical protein
MQVEVNGFSTECVSQRTLVRLTNFLSTFRPLPQVKLIHSLSKGGYDKFSGRCGKIITLTDNGVKDILDERESGNGISKYATVRGGCNLRHSFSRDPFTRQPSGASLRTLRFLGRARRTLVP